jgi:hypothetical protein
MAHFPRGRRLVHQQRRLPVPQQGKPPAPNPFSFWFQIPVRFGSASRMRRDRWAAPPGCRPLHITPPHQVRVRGKFHNSGNYRLNRCSCLRLANVAPTLRSSGNFFMASDSLISPGFADWNSVVVKYCDGSSFTSNNASITTVNATRLFHQGATM